MGQNEAATASPGAGSGFTVCIAVPAPAVLGGASLLWDRIAQASLFLRDALRQVPGCAGVTMAAVEGEGRLPIAEAAGGGEILPLGEALDTAGVLVIAGGFVEPAVLAAFRARGGRVVLFNPQNDPVSTVELAISPQRNLPAIRFAGHDCVDAIWVSDGRARDHAAWFRTLYRCPVVTVPEVWDPRCLGLVPAEARERFGYSAMAEKSLKKKKWKVGSAERSLSVTETFHMPALIYDWAHGTRPDSFAAMYLNDAARFAGDNHVESLFGALQSVKNGRMTAENAFSSLEFMANCNAIVSHRWGGGCNFTYYEALHGGYPLIHCAEDLRDYGYFYPEFDAMAGAKALLEAHRVHDRELEAYRAKAAELLARVSPLAGAVTARFGEAVAALA